MKYLLLTLLASATANAAIVKEPLQTCGIGKKCVSEQFTCLTKQPVKKAKKKLYKAPPQTVVPVVVEEEKPCEIVQNFYYDNEPVKPIYLSRPASTTFDRVTRPNSYISWHHSPPTYWGGYFGTIEREVIKTVYVSQPPVNPPIATPLPSAIWLLGSALGLFVFGRRY